MRLKRNPRRKNPRRRNNPLHNESPTPGGSFFPWNPRGFLFRSVHKYHTLQCPGVVNFHQLSAWKSSATERNLLLSVGSVRPSRMGEDSGNYLKLKYVIISKILRIKEIPLSSKSCKRRMARVLEELTMKKIDERRGGCQNEIA